MRILSPAITLVAAGLVASSCAGPDENAEAEADAGPSLEEVRTATERFQGTHTDFLEPAVVIYEPQSDGSLELVAVENLVFREAWEAAGHTSPPSFNAVQYNLMEDLLDTEVDEAHMFEPHHDLHVWLYRDNPNGMFEPFNPAVTCEHHEGATAEAG